MPEKPHFGTVVTLDLPEKLRKSELTREEQATIDIAERVYNNAEWGVAKFQRIGKHAVATIETPEGPVHYIGPPTAVVEGEERLLPFKVTEEAQNVRRVSLHPNQIEKTGVFGLIADLGKEGYEEAVIDAETDPEVDKLRLKPDKRNRLEAKQGRTFWKAFISERGVEDHLQLAREDEYLMQKGYEWYCRPDTQTTIGDIKNVPRRAARSGNKPGKRGYVRLVPPYVTRMPGPAETLLRSEQYTAERPPHLS